MKHLRQLFIILLFGCQIVYGQYYNERVLEKSFERTDFFFRPSFVNPYGIGGFLIDDPLLNLQINPAYLVADSLNNHYAYFNFRNSREVENRNSHFYPQYRSLGSPISSRLYYPIYFVNTQKALEPVFSGAYIFHPLGGKASRFCLGLTYQVILQDEPYYTIPQDIYKTNLEYDFAGNRVAEESDMPITDRYSGEDEMHQEGHFASLVSGIGLSQALQLGLRLSRVSFNRDGSCRSENVWNTIYYDGGSSSWLDSDSRAQDYKHWDISGGLNCRLSGNIIAGLMAGHLWGKADQDGLNENTSLYQYGQIDQGTDWNYYHRSYQRNQSWKHDGSSTYGGVNVKARLSSTQTLNIYYHILQENVDMQAQSVIRDTSYSNYHHDNNEWMYGSVSSSALDDHRTGSGNREGITHRAAVALQWDVDRRTRLHIGMNVQHKTRQTTTTEDVFADRYSDYTWSDNNRNDHSYSATEEQKELRWDFRTSLTTLRIPILLRYRASKSVEILFGVNRSMKRWHVEDVTLALFGYRIQTTNSVSKWEELFGERYTQPEEKRSDVTTALLGGLTINPSMHFNIRLLMVPNFAKTYQGTELREFQWWIDFNLFR